MTAMADDGMIPAITAGRRMELARREAGLTQQQLADELGISARSLIGYEQGARVPKRQTVIALSRVTGVSLRWLETGNAATPKGDGTVTDLRARRDSNSQPSDWFFAQVRPLVAA